jgi:hypothetical protein
MTHTTLAKLCRPNPLLPQWGRFRGMRYPVACKLQCSAAVCNPTQTLPATVDFAPQNLTPTYLPPLIRLAWTLQVLQPHWTLADSGL